jgi:hypothetical protein
MTTKQFNQVLHDLYDPPARDAVTKWVKIKWGLECRENPNVYGVDLLVYRADKLVGYIEVEVRSWDYCHYPTIHVGLRKEKLFQQDLPVLFFALTHDLTHAYWARTQAIEGSSLIEVKNTEVPAGELFFDVPVKHFKYVDLTQLF